MTDTLTAERQSARLAEMQDAFRDDVRLSEPFVCRPPLWIEPRSAVLIRDIRNACTWLNQNRSAIELALLSFGAILLRGFPISSTEDFADLMAGFEPFAKGYAGGTSDRKAIKGRVMEATRTPPELQIMLHQEMSYMSSNPRLLAFYCKRLAESGGETPIWASLAGTPWR